MRTVHLEAWTTAGRAETMAFVKGAIGRAGWLLDFTLFSSKAVAFSFEIDVGHLAALAVELETAGVFLRPDASQTIALASAGAGPRAVSLHLLFMHEGTDLRIEVPPIPG